MSVTVEVNRNNGLLTEVCITNVQEVKVRGSTVKLIQEEGLSYGVACNCPYAAEFAAEKIIKEQSLDYHETFLPLTQNVEVPEYFTPERVLANRLASIGMYNVGQLIAADTDAFRDLSYLDLVYLLRGKPVSNLNYEIISKTLFIPYRMFKLGIVPRDFWNEMRLRAQPSPKLEDAYFEHEAGFCPRYENGIRVR